MAELPLNRLDYKSYYTLIEFDAESKVLYGKIENANGDLVVFESDLAKEIEEITEKRIKNNAINFNYDKEHDLLYVSLKNCPNHYVDLLEDRHFDLPLETSGEEIEQLNERRREFYKFFSSRQLKFFLILRFKV